MTAPRSILRGLALLAIAVTVLACTDETRSGPLEGREGWDETADEVDRSLWLDSLEPDHVAMATDVRYLRNEVTSSGRVELSLFSVEVIDDDRVPEALRLGRSGPITVAETRGLEGRPSALLGVVETPYLVLTDSTADPATVEVLGTSTELQLPFTANEGGDVTFHGPDAERFQLEVDEARETAEPAGLAGATELDFVMALLVELSRYGDTDREALPAASILGVRAAAEDAANSPAAVWYDTPPRERALDAAIAPPEVVARMETAQVFVEIVGTYRQDEALDLYSTEGGILGIFLQGGETDFGDGYSVLTPPGGDWDVAIKPPDGSARSIGVVPAEAWSATGFVLVRVEGGSVTSRSISAEEFTELSRSAGTVVEGEEPEPGG